MKVENLELAEMAIVGRMIEDPSAIDWLATRLSSEDFFYDDCREMFSMLSDLRWAGMDTSETPLLLREARARGIWPSNSKAVARISALHDNRSSEASLSVFTQDVKNASLWRSYVQTIERAYQDRESVGDPKSAIGGLVASLERLGVNDASESISMSEAIRRVAQREAESCSVVTTGLDELDLVIGGFRPGVLYVLAARPSIGKSALGLQFARAAATDQQRAVLISIEMDNEELGAREIAVATGIAANRAMSGRLSVDERERALELADQVQSLPLFLLEKYSPRIDELVATIRLEVAKGAKLIVIDYLSLVSDVDRKKDLRERIGNITKQLKNTARRCKVPIVLLSQLNREAEGRSEAKTEGKTDAITPRPTLKNLKDSGDIEQDADVVLFIHRPNRYSPSGEAELIVAKQRNGPVDSIEMRYEGARFQFVEASQERGFV